MYKTTCGIHMLDIYICIRLPYSMAKMNFFSDLSIHYPFKDISGLESKYIMLKYEKADR